jgi:hypothetical protein
MGTHRTRHDGRAHGACREAERLLMSPAGTGSARVSWSCARPATASCEHGPGTAAKPPTSLPIGHSQGFGACGRARGTRLHPGLVPTYGPAPEPEMRMGGGSGTWSAVRSTGTTCSSRRSRTSEPWRVQKNTSPSPSPARRRIPWCVGAVTSRASVRSSYRASHTGVASLAKPRPAQLAAPELPKRIPQSKKFRLIVPGPALNESGRTFRRGMLLSAGPWELRSCASPLQPSGGRAGRLMRCCPLPQ